MRLAVVLIIGAVIGSLDGGGIFFTLGEPYKVENFLAAILKGTLVSLLIGLTLRARRPWWQGVGYGLLYGVGFALVVFLAKGGFKSIDAPFAVPFGVVFGGLTGALVAQFGFRNGLVTVPEPDRQNRTKGPTLDRLELWTQLTNAIHLTSAVNTVYWTIFGIFGAANAVLLVALFPNGKLPTNCFGSIISALGIVMSFMWYVMQKRSLAHLERYEKLVERIEKELGFDPKYATSAKINLEDWERYLRNGPAIRPLMRDFSVLALIIWTMAFAFFLFWQS